MNRRSISLLIVLLILSSPSGFAQGMVGHDNFTPPMLDVLSHSTSMVVYSLEAEYARSKQKQFHGYVELGETVAPEAADRIAVGEQLMKIGVGDVRFCGFQPHHGVRLSCGARTLEFVICFRCGVVEIYENGEYWNHGVIKSLELEQRLNRILSKQAIPQAQDYLAKFGQKKNQRTK